MLEVNGLTKHYGKLVAVSGVSFRADRGETIGLLGPNGAGKTTTVSIISGLLNAVVVIAVVIYLLQVFGLLGTLENIKVGHT